MKTKIKNPFVLPTLIVAIGLVPANRVTAQTFTTLHSFTATSCYSCPNSDGAGPSVGLIMAGDTTTLYGTTVYGGSYGGGTLFKVNTDGKGFTALHSFTAPSRSNGDTSGGLILAGNTLYGATSLGGSSGDGAVFAVKTDGSGFANLYSFTSTDPNGYNTDGANPSSGLILAGNTLYGTAEFGGPFEGWTGSGDGTVFAVNTDGTGFRNLHDFTAMTYNSIDQYTNSDGAHPVGGLSVSDSILYGIAQIGGSDSLGTVFKVSTNGTGFTVLHTFTGGGDGANPFARLLVSGNSLYGTAELGGSSDNGTVFALNTDGTRFTNLHTFSATSALPSRGGTNIDGAGPVAGLTLSGNTLYGTTSYGGIWGNGTVFAVNTDGTGFSVLHAFTITSTNSSGVYTNSEGAGPAGLILSGSTLYGTASGGGTWGNGTVFSLSFRPQLTITLSGTNVILTWPTHVAGFDYTGYTLQSTMNLGPSAAWATNFPAPVVINGQNTVTNPISGPQRFYRLIQ
jgi:uncharacterized repeat protein (TIGR03803 family)